MAPLHTVKVPEHLDGPSLVAAASGLMLIPDNASTHIRLHRLAALGMSLSHRSAPRASPSSVRAILKQDGIGGSDILLQEDPYSEVLIQSVSFFGGPYLVSPGSGEHSVADLENLLEAAFREDWMPKSLRSPTRQLVQGLLTVSDTVLRRAGLARGVEPTGSGRNAVNVPGADRLAALVGSTFLSTEDLDVHGEWLRAVVDTFALDVGELTDPCTHDVTDDRLYTHPFLRLPDGYRLALPLDLSITIRFHLLRFAQQEDKIQELGKHYRQAALRRIRRLLPASSSPTKLEQSTTMERYLFAVDDKRDVHVVLATDPLTDWQREVWGFRDTNAALERLSRLALPNVRQSYSSSEELLHLVIVDSPGRGAFWGVPNVDGSDPMLIARSDDLEVMLHHEADGLLGLMLFAQAIANRAGESMSTDILDEYASYLAHERSFYFSDGQPPHFTVFQPADGLVPRQIFAAETDRHGVVLPGPKPRIVQAQRRYARDAPEIYFVEPSSSYFGYVVELHEHSFFVRLDSAGDYGGLELALLECTAYWIRECALRGGTQRGARIVELILDLGSPRSWKHPGETTDRLPAVVVETHSTGYIVRLSEAFVGLVQEPDNRAERELVAALLTTVYDVSAAALAKILDAIAPLGPKRMLNGFDQNRAPEMLAAKLPHPLTSNGQVKAQLLDNLGEWLGSPTGGGFAVGECRGEERVAVLNAAVGHLFGQLELEVEAYNKRQLLDFLVAQNEALVHRARLNSLMLTSRLACFGEHSNTVVDLVRDQKDSTVAQRANRFLIEYVAARPPSGERQMGVLDYYRALSIAEEIMERGTTSDFLHYGLADFQVSMLESGRLGVSREEPVVAAMDTYVLNSGTRSIRSAQVGERHSDLGAVDALDFVALSERAMRAEFAFTLVELREVCGGLLDLAAADQVTRIHRAEAIARVASARGISEESVSAVVDKITLRERASFMSIGQDAFPWRFSRDMSYVRRPILLQGDELVFGFRSLLRLGPFWLDNLLSGRLQARARTIEMRRFISEARSRINDAFAELVATRIVEFGFVARVAVKKIGKRRISDSAGQDIGDIDILAALTASRSILAIEAKDFEVARTPSEIAHEVEKLFAGKPGKRSTVELHGRRVEWLREHLAEVVEMFVPGQDPTQWQVNGLVVTSDPLISPLTALSPLRVIAFDDLDVDAVAVPDARRAAPRNERRRRH